LVIFFLNSLNRFPVEALSSSLLTTTQKQTKTTSSTTRNTVRTTSSTLPSTQKPITTTTTTTSSTTSLKTTTPSLKTIINSNVNTLIKNRNATKLPKQIQLDRTNIQSNFRQTSNTGIFVNDITNLVINFIQNQVNQSVNITQTLTLDPANCPFNITNLICDPNNKYQSYDGSCNNLQNPSYGMSNLPFKRFLPLAYGDGFNSPRMLGVSGKPLPNVRLLSLAISVPVAQQRLKT
jgi:hypothetical protein